MDPSCLKYCLTLQERQQFEENGFFIVKDALPLGLVENLIAAADHIDNDHKHEFSGFGGRNHFDVIGKDDLFLELLDWPKTFPKVWGLLGWHIQLYHSHFMVTPPWPADQAREFNRLGWHQDSGRLNVDIESVPRPRISLKVSYFSSRLRFVSA